MKLPTRHVNSAYFLAGVGAGLMLGSNVYTNFELWNGWFALGFLFLTVGTAMTYIDKKGRR